MSADAASTTSSGRDAGAVATEQLRRLIVDGEIPPGTELSQVELARMLGVSTTPVREALRQLEVEGLVQSRRNHRPRVPAFDPGDLDAVYCSRVLLESLAIKLSVAAMSATELGQIGADLEQMRRAGAAEDLPAWDKAHSSFHTRLVFDCEPALRHQIRQMMFRSDRYRRMSVLGDRPHAWAIGESEHEAILDACVARDGDLAARLLARHLARSARSVLNHLAPEWDGRALDTAVAMAESGAPRPS